MAAPKHTPVLPTNNPRIYTSPEHVPGNWTVDRPGMLDGRQPRGASLGNQGPDQGYVLTLARRVRKNVRVKEGESVDDAIQGTIAIALSRSSIQKMNRLLGPPFWLKRLKKWLLPT